MSCIHTDHFVCEMTDRNGRQSYENKTRAIERQQCVSGFLLISPTRLCILRSEGTQTLTLVAPLRLKACSLKQPMEIIYANITPALLICTRCVQQWNVEALETRNRSVVIIICPLKWFAQCVSSCVSSDTLFYCCVFIWYVLMLANANIGGSFILSVLLLSQL